MNNQKAEMFIFIERAEESELSSRWAEAAEFWSLALGARPKDISPQDTYSLLARIQDCRNRSLWMIP